MQSLYDISQVEWEVLYLLRLREDGLIQAIFHHTTIVESHKFYKNVAWLN